MSAQTASERVQDNIIELQQINSEQNKCEARYNETMRSFVTSSRHLSELIDTELNSSARYMWTSQPTYNSAQTTNYTDREVQEILESLCIKNRQIQELEQQLQEALLHPRRDELLQANEDYRRLAEKLDAERRALIDVVEGQAELISTLQAERERVAGEDKWTQVSLEGTSSVRPDGLNRDEHWLDERQAEVNALQREVANAAKQLDVAARQCRSLECAASRSERKLRWIAGLCLCSYGAIAAVVAARWPRSV